MISEGETVTSIGSLAAETGLTSQQVRTALKKLEKTGEIIRRATNKNTLIIVVNYTLYQGFSYDEQQTNNKRSNKQVTIKQQSNNNQITTNKNDKNDKNDKKYIYGEFENVKLTADEYEKVKSLGLLPLIEELSCYIAQKGDKYKSHYATIRAWGRKREAEKPKQNIANTYDIDKITHDAMYNDDYDI